MKEISVVSWCDYPGCIDTARTAKNASIGQDVTPVEFWVYVPGKGRKPNTIRVEMCEDHLTEMKALFHALSKFNQRDAAEVAG
jgi:hypothetical protein